jgi:PAS domain S-box-containing protein
VGLSTLESGGGEVARDLLAIDWEATPLGDPQTWPISLQTMVRVILTSRFSMWMAWGPELTFFCNDAYRRDTLGKKYPWALGRPARQVWEEIWPEIGPRIERVIATGEATWDEDLLLFLERSGYSEETYHTFSYSALPDEAGDTAGMLCVVSEVTDRVLAERRMSTLRDLGDVTPGDDEIAFAGAACRQLERDPRSLPFTIVYLLDEDGGATLAGSAGIEPGHQAAPRRIPPGALDAPWPLAEAAEGVTAIVEKIDEVFPELPSGAWALPPQTGLVAPIHAAAGSPPHGFLVIGLNRYRPLDVDTRVFAALIAQRLSAGLAAARSHVAERRRAEQLAELDRAKTVFFSNVSHELRTPLTLMLGPLQDALQETGELGRARLELVHRNGLRLLKLVNALLDFAKLEAGRMRAEFRPLDLAAFTSQLAGTFRDAAARAGVELIVDCVRLPERVYADPDLWERIVLNLLSNAFKVTLQGTIAVRLRPLEAGGAELSVTDTGPGIAPEEIALLFQRFHRVRGATSRSNEGTGIGLALVKELAELHGGQVSVASVVGEGSTFSVRLPSGRGHLPSDQVRDDVDEDSSPLLASLFVEEAIGWTSGEAVAEAEGARALSAEGIAAEAGHRLDVSRSRLLIADDNADLRGYLRRLLEPYWEVEAVGDGAEALARIGADPPDLVITDVMMPGLDGFALLQAIRADPETRQLPVIMLSARAGEEASIEGLEAGADDYLPKPFSGRELLARVSAHLELSLVRRQAADEVRSERLRLEQTLQQLPMGVMLIDADSGEVVLVNDQVEAILGRSMTEAPEPYRESSDRWRTLEGSPLTVEQRPLARVLRTGEVVDEEDLLYERPNGAIITARLSAGPICDDDGRPFAVVIVIQDVTEDVSTARLLAGQRDVLTLIATGAPLQDTLAAITDCVERLSDPGTRAAIRLSDGGIADAEAQEPPGADARSSTPIRAADGEVLGTLIIAGPRSAAAAARERRVAELLSRTAAVAIDRDRDAESRARRLSELQSSLLPRALPEVPGLDTAVTFLSGDRALDVGGDFYDVLPLAGGCWGFIVGDVRGHGAEAAAVTALTRHTTRAIGRMRAAPGEVLAFVSDALRDSGYDRFCTAVYGEIEPAADGMRIRLACGGHPPPLIRRAGGEVESVTLHGPLLGVFESATFPEVVVELHLGDVLVLYTDGLVERNARIGDEAALPRLLAAMPDAPATDFLRLLLDAVLGPEPRAPADDVAVLVLRAARASDRRPPPTLGSRQ